MTPQTTDATQAREGMPQALRLPLTAMDYVDTADIMDADGWFITRCANTKGCDIFTPEEVKAHARQLVHACNAFPALVEALEAALKDQVRVAARASYDNDHEAEARADERVAKTKAALKAARGEQ